MYVQATALLLNGTDLNGNSAALGGGLFWDVDGNHLSSALTSGSPESLFGGKEE